MTVIKRDKQSSAKDLVEAAAKFADLLDDQGENEAANDLRAAAKTLGQTQPTAANYQKAVGVIIAAFDGDHELSSYIIQKPNPNEWTEADELSQAATRVLSLAKRLRA